MKLHSRRILSFSIARPDDGEAFIVVDRAGCCGPDVIGVGHESRSIAAIGIHGSDGCIGGSGGSSAAAGRDVARLAVELLASDTLGTTGSTD